VKGFDTLSGRVMCIESIHKGGRSHSLSLDLGGVEGAIEEAKKNLSDDTDLINKFHVFDMTELGLYEVFSQEGRVAYIPYKKRMISNVDGDYYDNIYCNSRFDPNADFDVSRKCGFTIVMGDGYFLMLRFISSL